MTSRSVPPFMRPWPTPFIILGSLVLSSVISIKGWALTTGFKNSKIVRTQVASTVRKRNDFTTGVLLLVGPKGSGAELKKVKAICLTNVFWSFSQFLERNLTRHLKVFRKELELNQSRNHEPIQHMLMLKHLSRSVILVLMLIDPPQFLLL